jgi:putative sugar O-methyltransferase
MSEKLVKDILTSYQKSLKFYKDFKTHKSLHWQRLISKKNFVINKNNLENFRNNNLSYGHDDSNKITKDQFRYLIKKILLQTGSKFFFKNLSKNNIGFLKNIFYYHNYKIDAGEIFFVKWLYDLKKIISKENTKYVCEIGGGYGGFAKKIVKNLSCKYILIDLPETNCLSSFYLKKNFPKKKFLLYSDLKNNLITQDHLNKFDIIIMPPWVKLYKLNIDLFINTRSMMEMNYNIIQYYFNLIHENISKNGYFLNINRYAKFRVGHPIFLKDYPYDNNWEVLISKKSWQQDHIHFLLTQRKFNFITNSIRKEMQIIEKETLNYIQPDEVRYLNKDYFKEKQKYFFIRKTLKVILPANIHYFLKQVLFFLKKR